MEKVIGALFCLCLLGLVGAAIVALLPVIIPAVVIGGGMWFVFSVLGIGRG